MLLAFSFYSSLLHKDVENCPEGEGQREKRRKEEKFSLVSSIVSSQRRPKLTTTTCSHRPALFS